MKNWVFVDIETTGLNAKKHEAIEIAALKCHFEKIYPYSMFQTMIYPEMGIIKEACEINGITEGMVKYAAHLEDALNDLFNYFGPSDILVGHNIKKFDRLFIEQHGHEIENEIIDTLELAQEVGLKLGQISQKKLAHRFKIDYPKDAHRAEADVKLNWRIFKKLWAMKQNKLF